jgi:decaprenyl-phosphate phosphoribosyltransferase
MLRGLLLTMRPKQWVKNLLVVAAPLAAGRLGERSVAGHTAVAFVAFCLAASAVYCFNDALDRLLDAEHAVKRHRPVASGALPRQVALGTAAVLAVAAEAIGVNAKLRIVLAVYLALSAAYALGLKRVAVVEYCIVASGFLLRAIAGGVAAHIPLSQWFLIVAAFGSLFMVSGKRLSELVEQGDRAVVSRPILARYSLSYLRMVTVFAAAVTVAAYSLWAFEVAAPKTAVPWATLSIAPLVVALLRYALDVDAGRAQEPEQIVLRDRVIQLLGLCWLVTFVLAVHGG